MLEDRPDVFIGVDFNVCNLLLERLLKRRGIATVHYVSPPVYACRRGRVKRIGLVADLVMRLYPFEPRAELSLRKLPREFPDLDVRLLPGAVQRALVAAKVALVNSGTGTLEAMLLRKPMVVTYRLGALS